MKIIYGVLLTAGMLVSGAPVGRAAETFESLAARLPGEANALVLIDVEQVLNSPLARAQGWGRKLEAAYVERPVFLPPEAKKLALGAALLPSKDFVCAWEAAAMELSEPPSVRAIARSESGYVDQINGQTAAISPIDAAFVDLGDNVLGAARPAERQFLSRWISRAREQTKPELSAYLQESLPLVSDSVQMLLAVDLTDVLSPRDISEKLAGATWLPSEQTDVDAIAKVVESLRGATLRLAVGEKCQAQLQIDFDAEVAPLGDAAQPLVLQALGNLGFDTAALAEWETSLAPRAIKMRGELSADAQRRVFSVIELPVADMSGNEAAADAGTPSESDAREHSLTYFKATQVLVKDLRKGMRDTKATSAWMERYSRRLDELPTLYVDEMLIDYGDKLAETLRIMSVSKRQAGIRAGVRGSEGGGYYDGYSYNAYDSAADRSQARKEEMSVASDARVEGWRLIDDATADIRRSMTKKYSAEF